MKIQLPIDLEKALDVAVALASKRRLGIIIMLQKNPMTLAEIHRQAGGSKYASTTYRNLKILVRAGLLEKFYDDGVKYRIKSKEVIFRTWTN